MCQTVQGVEYSEMAMSCSFSYHLTNVYFQRDCNEIVYQRCHVCFNSKRSDLIRDDVASHMVVSEYITNSIRKEFLCEFVLVLVLVFVYVYVYVCVNKSDVNIISLKCKLWLPLQTIWNRTHTNQVEHTILNACIFEDDSADGVSRPYIEDSFA